MNASAAPREPAGSCPLCGGSDFGVVLTAYDRMRARAEDYQYGRCAACGLVALTPLPSAGEIQAFYPADYHARIDSWQRDLDKPVNRVAIKYFYGVNSVAQPRLVRACFRAASRHILAGLCEPRGGNRMLDVGCGTGSTLAVYRRLGWAAHGIELNPGASAVCRARGLTVHEGTVFDAPFDAQFDVVLLSHFIEHVREPVAVLRRAAEFLAPGGALRVVTPNARGIGFAVYRSCWFPLDAPRHLFLFDPRTIRLLGSRAGLHAGKIATRSSPQSLCDSRHYATSQGQRLPAGLARRTEIVERSWRQKPRSRVYRDLVTPLSALAALAGRGDLIEAEFARPGRY